MFQRIYFMIFLVTCLLVSFSGPAPAIAQTNPVQGFTEGNQAPEFLQKLENAAGYVSDRIVAAATHIRNIPDELIQLFNLLPWVKDSSTF